MLDAALGTVSRVVVAGNTGVGSCDMAAKRQGSGLERRAWGNTSGAVGRLGRVCCRF